MVLLGYSGAQGTMIYEKNLKSKISCQTPFNMRQYVVLVNDDIPQQKDRTPPKGNPGQLAYTFLICILSTSFISVSIFSVCCYSRVSISMGATVSMSGGVVRYRRCSAGPFVVLERGVKVFQIKVGSSISVDHLKSHTSEEPVQPAALPK